MFGSCRLQEVAMILLSAVLPAASAAVAALRHGANVAAKPVAALLRILRHRREISKLAELDDHHLKDIGLTRTDVSGALAVSLLDDPSRVLCDIAGSGHSYASLAANLSVRRPVVITALVREV
jgi:uncharacterized protein YjiS (DUF1127 family)